MDASRKKRIFFWALCGLAALLAAVGAAAFLWGKGGGEPAPSGGEVSFRVPENELLVEDLYEGRTLIPKFRLPQNKYDVEKFQETEGRIQYADPGAQLGVDVSEYQREIDWHAVKGAGIDFAFLRLGYRGMTQGLLNVDSVFERNYEGARSAGLDVGVYFFSQAVTEAEAEAEAQFVLDTLGGRELTYPVAFDWENPVPSPEQGLPADKLRAYGMKGGEITACAKAFCQKIQEAGYTPILYTNKSMAYGFFDLEELRDYGLWYAEYQKAPSLYYDFRIWQYTDAGKVDGIEGGVDLNICFQAY